MDTLLEFIRSPLPAYIMLVGMAVNVLILTYYFIMVDGFAEALSPLWDSVLFFIMISWFVWIFFLIDVYFIWRNKRLTKEFMEELWKDNEEIYNK